MEKSDVTKSNETSLLEEKEKELREKNAGRKSYMFSLSNILFGRCCEHLSLNIGLVILIADINNCDV